MKKNKTLRMLAIAAFTCVIQANAQWNYLPTSTNNEVVGSTLGATDQRTPDISAINPFGYRYAMAWQDRRNATTAQDIYAQCYNGTGYTQWGSTGALICNATGQQQNARIVSDNGGAYYIAWDDQRTGSGNYDIYIQKVSSSGSPLWTSNGVAVVTACGSQTDIQMVVLSSGDVVVTWVDDRNGDKDIYAQKFDASSGTAQWRTNGIPVGFANGDQVKQKIVEGASNSFVIVWEDQAAASIYGQLIDVNGDPQWTTTNTGLQICTYSSAKSDPELVISGSNFFVAWIDQRTSGDPYYILIDNTGAPISSSSGTKAYTSGMYTGIGARSIKMISDRSSGAYIAWDDVRNGNYDIYAQRIASTGSYYGGSWSNAGTQVVNDMNDQRTPQMATCDDELIISFEDLRSYSTNGVDLYYQSLTTSSSALNLGSAGAALSNKLKDQKNHRVTVMNDKVVAVWDDFEYSAMSRGIDVFCSPIVITCSTYPSTTSFVTSIDAVESKEISLYKVYPNPASLEIRISHPTATTIGKIIISSIDGKVVKSIENFTVGNSIDVSDLSVGEYIIHFSDSQSTSYFKIQKQ